MSFDNILECNGLDPNDPKTVLMMSLDDMTFEGLTLQDVVDAVDELQNANPKDIDPRIFNMAYFVSLILKRGRELGWVELDRTESASCLHRERDSRMIN